MLANGNPIDFDNFRHVSGYVMQSDALYPHLTVRETIQYAAYLRCHGKTKKECQVISADLIRMLRLEDCAETRIGNELVRGISGGQKRRVTIAVDIVHQPSVIFIDEPTSGLDSVTAYGVIDTIRSIASTSGHTVVMAMNQPSNKVFNLFHRVMFLSHGAQIFYGETSSLLPYASALLTKHDVRPVGWNTGGTDALMQGNPPEVFLEISDQLYAENRGNVLLQEAQVQKDERARQSVAGDVEAGRLSVFGGEEGKSLGALSLFEYSNTVLREIKILNNRQFKTVFRSPEVFHMRMGACVCFGVLLGTFFLHTQNNADGVADRASYFIFICAFFYFTSLDALQSILAEREIFQREFSRGAYRAVSFVASSTIVIMPFMLLMAFTFSLISYFLVNLPAVIDIFLFDVLAVFMILLTGFCFSQMISVVAPDPMAGQVVGVAIFSVMFLTSGFFQPKASTPSEWVWLYYVSVFHWGFGPLMINGLSQTSYDDLSSQDVLAGYGLNGSSRWNGIGMLCLFIVVFRVVFYRVLTERFSGQRVK